MKEPEQMADFFNARAETYDDHMRETVSWFEEFYDSVSTCIAKTKDQIHILNIGIGTGLELKGIFEQAPNAIITGIDMSEEMLNKLKEKYVEHLKQITLVQESFMTFPFGEATYDYIVSVMTLHHLLPNEKLKLYERVKKALKNTGKYIEGDFVVTDEEASNYLRKYEEWSKANKGIEEGSHHIDIPLSFETQRCLLAKAGFSEVRVIRQGSKDAVYCARP
ncbi:MAG: class I SAM-dependent methyltransferase [Promethearchaeota archaeon]